MKSPLYSSLLTIHYIKQTALKKYFYLCNKYNTNTLRNILSKHEKIFCNLFENLQLYIKTKFFSEDRVREKTSEMSRRDAVRNELHPVWNCRDAVKNELHPVSPALHATPGGWDVARLRSLHPYKPKPKPL